MPARGYPIHTEVHNIFSHHNLRSENPENIVAEEPCKQYSGRREARDTYQADALRQQTNPTQVQ